MERLLLRLGITRGLLGNSRVFLVLGGAAAAWRLMKVISGRQPEVVYTGKLDPGRALIISHLPETHAELRRSRRLGGEEPR